MPCFTISGISLFVAEIRRISTGITLLLPRRVTFRLCNTVRSLVWSGRGRLPSSSMNSELPLAASNFPGRLSWASVKAPRSCPNSSLSNSDSLMAPISTFSIGRAPRGERRCISRASISLPVPFSPVIRMLASVRATFDTTFISCNMAGERPTSISNPSALSTFAVRSGALRLR